MTSQQSCFVGRLSEKKQILTTCVLFTLLVLRAQQDPFPDSRYLVPLVLPFKLVQKTFTKRALQHVLN